ncbi:MAG: Protein of unknown function (DUF2726) [Candidatus Nitrotoga sp. SPKER]|nr:MAG: Protein of unknown function (DUF2726) [Candidatus Nitrotoga sp. SPKER]
MRLADVIKADWKQFKYIKGYHLDFVICNQSGDTIAAVELDDSTHDNRKAQERDAKKNKYLNDANIKLIRIHDPQETIGIRKLIDEYKFFTEFSKESWRPSLPNSNIRQNNKSKAALPFQKIAIMATGILLIWLAFNQINQILKKNIEKALLPQNLKIQKNDALQ